MAGSPKKRQRLEQQQAQPAAEVPVSTPVPADAMRARARASTPRAPGAPTVGPVTRATADAGQAAALAELGRHLRPGYVLRLERLQPSWCAGWVDDVPVDGTSLGQLYQHIRAEYGGLTYRAVVLGAQETPVYEGRIAIASPPMLAGRLIDRDAWDQAMGGRSARAPAHQPVPTSTPASGEPKWANDLVSLLFEQQRESNRMTLDAVKDSANTMRELVQQVVNQRETRTQQAQPRSLLEQINELAEANVALDRFGKTFGRARDGDAPPEADDALAQAAKSMFLQNMLGSMMPGGPYQRPQQQQPPPNGHTQVPVSVPRSRGIPSQPKK